MVKTILDIVVVRLKYHQLIGCRIITELYSSRFVSPILVNQYLVFAINFLNFFETKWNNECGCPLMSVCVYMLSVHDVWSVSVERPVLRRIPKWHVSEIGLVWWHPWPNPVLDTYSNDALYSSHGIPLSTSFLALEWFFATETWEILSRYMW